MVPVFTDDVKKQCLGPFNISEADVIEVFSAPEQSQVIELEGKGISRIMMFLGRTARGEAILVIGEPQDETFSVRMAFKVPSSIAGPSGATDPPLKILEQFAHRFGFAMMVGERICKFLLNERIPIKDPQQVALPNVQNFGAPYYLSWMVGTASAGGQSYADCSLCFALDLNTYRKAIGAIPAPVGHDLPQERGRPPMSVIIQPEARQVMSYTKLSEQRVIEAVTLPTRGLADKWRAYGIRWFDEGQIVFVESAVIKSHADGQKRRLEQISVNLAIQLRQRLPAGELKPDDPIPATLALIVASFGLPVRCHPDFGFSKLYSGPWDGKKPQIRSTEAGDLLLIRGTFNTIDRTCQSVWAFSSNTYKRWWNSLRMRGAND